MRKFAYLHVIVLAMLNACNTDGDPDFNRYFTEGTLRIDYFHSGDAATETVVIDETYRYDAWAGSKKNLLDTLELGTYKHSIVDPETNREIYSRGFDSYFKEYQFTTAAIEGKQKQYHESAIIPLPRSAVDFLLEKRDKYGEIHEVFRTRIDPAEASEAPFDSTVKVFPSLVNGDPSVKADVVIIGEGYTVEETAKFELDLARFTEVFFRAEPCKTYKEMFNINGVLKASEDSGVDEPRAGIDKNTAVNASFNSLGSERYLLTEDNKSLRDIAGHAPYDALYIMVNHSRYGGGGIYNFYCVYTSDNIESNYLMVHEFGHSFFGLADEYYTSSTSYNDFYPAGFEPNEANITALLDPENVKWKHLVGEGMEIPTDWNKAEFDSLDNAWQTRRAEMNERTLSLKASGAPAEQVAKAQQEYNEAAINRDAEVDRFLESGPLAGKVGAFEGAGYASTGLYRPCLNCIMFSRTDYFCPVCQEAMVKVIMTYSE